MDGRAGLGRQQIITTKKNENLIENLASSPEDNLVVDACFEEMSKKTLV